MRTCVLCLTLLCAGCGVGDWRNRGGTVDGKMPDGVARVCVVATRQAYARVQAGEDAQAVCEDGADRMNRVCQAYDITPRSPVWQSIKALVFSSALQCNYEDEIRRYDQLDEPSWRNVSCAIPPRHVRGKTCVSGGTIPDPCSLAGFLMRGGR